MVGDVKEEHGFALYVVSSLASQLLSPEKSTLFGSSSFFFLIAFYCFSEAVQLLNTGICPDGSSQRSGLAPASYLN